MRLDRRAKIKLLLSTLLDATSPGRGTSDVRIAFGSRPPAKSELWHEGSYHELHRCLDALKARNEDPAWRGVHWHVWRRYVTGDRFESRAPWKFDKGLAFLEESMPRDIFVPVEVSENGGFLPSDARTAARPRDLRRAA